MKLEPLRTLHAAGVYHSGVEVDGVEYGYGGHDSMETGIWEVFCNVAITVDRIISDSALTE